MTSYLLNSGGGGGGGGGGGERSQCPPYETLVLWWGVEEMTEFPLIVIPYYG